MDNKCTSMDKTNNLEFGIYREEKFRIPSTAEKLMRLWVDRVGRETTGRRPEELRILGQYAYVHVLAGTGVYLSEATGRINVGAGDCMVVFPDVPILYYPHDQWTTCWVTWNGDEGRELEELNLLRRDAPAFPDPGAATVTAYSELVDIMHDESPAAALQRKNIVLTLVRQTFQAAHDAEQKPVGSPLMKKATTWLHDHYSESVCLEDVAARFHMSASQFRRRFKAYTGRSPGMYLTMLRIAEAKRLLLEGVPIKQVAPRVGYSDVFYFMRIFKKHAGVTAARFQSHKE